MSGVRHLIQDLRAEAHRAPADIAQLMRAAADALDVGASHALVRIDMDLQLTDPPKACPFPPPLESYELGADEIDDGALAASVGEVGAAHENVAP